MEDFIKGVTRAGGEQWMGFIFLLALSSLLFTGVYALTSDHSVRCYYLKTTSTQAGLSYQIRSDIDWAEDKTAFASADEDKTLSVLSSLKQCASKQQ